MSPATDRRSWVRPAFGRFSLSANSNSGFPRVTAAAWWTLRRQFLKTPPSTVDGDYIATQLDISAASAQSNVLPGLKATGLVGEDNKLTERGLRWRHDDEYAAVCEEIRTELYPEDLRHAFDATNLDRERLVNWFQSRMKKGRDVAVKAAQLYEILTEADPTKADAKLPRTTASGVVGARRISGGSNGRNARGVQHATSENAPPLPLPGRAAPTPSLHIDIQIHISPESSADQIDHIFESMARHLYSRENLNGK